MARETDEVRNFTLREETGEETSRFTGKTPRQAALKAARRFDPADSESEATRIRFRIRETGTKKLHIYEGWAWRDEAPPDKPDWMPETITEANVSKEGVEHLDEL
ncbi:non-histone chromosomal MC1 family protein [Halococcus sediminicola]|uniref:non-histone chromosomal MC1 family protein n=1 Tax=Halococcus sediminicola TaxID=1264579 RepID=UPI000678D5B3|nr:non-histone chromosomal MC1 family protein [Halococcus sediminicola]